MRKKKSAPFSIGHVDADTILEMNEPYTPSANDFAPADAAEKESFITRAKSTSYWKDAWRRLRKNTVAMIALGVIIFLVLFAFVGPLLTPYDYSTQMRNEENWPPFWRDADPIVQQKADEAGIKIDKSKHILGTDSLGRDNLTRLMYGTRISITIGLAASLIVLIVGSLIGAISGYLGGAADVVIMRITEIIYSVPDVLVVLLLSTGLKESISAYISNHPGSFSMFLNSIGANLIGMFITFGLIYWVGMCRIIRAQAAGICHRSPCTRCKRQQDHQKASASQLCRTDNSYDLPSDTVLHLSGVLPILPWNGRQCTADEPWLHGIRRTERHLLSGLSVPSYSSCDTAEPSHPLVQSLWRWPA